MKISFLPSFIKKFKKLEKSLQEEALEKIELFEDAKNHKQLKVHKLHGVLVGRYSFSVNYRFRIVFVYLSKSEAVLLTIGDHEVYDK